VRLAGTRMCAAFGREIKASNVLDLFVAEDRHAIATLATAVFEDGAAAVVTVAAAAARQRPLPCEILFLPLRHGGTKYERILGSFAPFERPYWLGSEPIDGLSVVSLRLIWPDEKPTYMRRASDQPESSRPIPFPLHRQKRRGHLTVFEGGKD
jgi:hypothetical protein